MKSFAILALTAVALAAPVMEKREVVYETVYEQVYETVQTTTTLWVDPTPEPAAAAATTPAAFYEQPKAEAEPAPAASSSAAPAPVVAAAPEAKPVEAAPAAAPSSEAAYVPAASPSPAPVAAAPAQSYVPEAAPATDNSGSSSSSGQGDHTGDITYYDVEVGTGSCGTTASNSDAVVALSKLDMNNGINPNANPLCGQMINIYYNGQVTKAKVHDTCPACASGSLDMPESLFQKIAPGGDGRVHGVSWSFA